MVVYPIPRNLPIMIMVLACLVYLPRNTPSTQKSQLWLHTLSTKRRPTERSWWIQSPAYAGLNLEDHSRKPSAFWEHFFYLNPWFFLYICFEQQFWNRRMESLGSQGATCKFFGSYWISKELLNYGMQKQQLDMTCCGCNIFCMAFPFCSPLVSTLRFGRK